MVHMRERLFRMPGAGMMGKGGELNIQLEYLVAPTITSGSVAQKAAKVTPKLVPPSLSLCFLVLLGLIKHGKEVQIPAGTPFVAYIDQHVWLPPAQ